VVCHRNEEMVPSTPRTKKMLKPKNSTNKSKLTFDTANILHILSADVLVIFNISATFDFTAVYSITAACSRFQLK